MRAAHPDAADEAIAALREGLGRYFAEARGRSMRAADPEFDVSPELIALRQAPADRIEADLAALDALGGDPDLEDDELDHDAGDGAEEDYDPDAIIDQRTPRRYRGGETRKRELVAEARMGLHAVRRRKAMAPASNLRLVPFSMIGGAHR